MAASKNGGQEFGEVKANVQSLVKVLDDFRTETRESRKELLEALKEMRQDVNGRFGKNEAEIGALKKWRWYTSGVAGGIGLAAGLAAKALL